MTAPKRDRPLTRTELLDAALKIVDVEGLPALTMRRLAESVGVEAMSLYNHVPNKGALLDLTVERMRAEMRLPEPLPADWTDLMAAIFGEYRRVLVVHPNMLPLASRRIGGVALLGLDFLIARGFPLDDAVELYQSLAAFTVGYATLSVSEPGSRAGLSPELAGRARDFRDSTYAVTLRMIIDDYGTRRTKEH